MKKVNVLMSSHNGEKYISEQIESIINQKGVQAKLILRDDGSEDSTVRIASSFSSVDVIKGKNIGVGRSFMRLLERCGHSDYYAFSDQDDIWYPEKLVTAIRYIENSAKRNTLYVCNQDCVDQDSGKQNIRFMDDFAEQTLVGSVFSNYYAGCTMVFGNNLRDLLLDKKRKPDDSFFDLRIHDAWISCVALTVGNIIFDRESHMIFRRHGYNATDERTGEGKGIDYLQGIVPKIKRLSKHKLKRKGISKTAYYLRRGYADYMDEITLKKIGDIADYDRSLICRLRFVLGNTIRESKDIKTTRIKSLLGVL